MQMSNEEIVRRYREAKDKGKQIGILADLNACDKKQIRDILVAGGISYRTLPRERKETKTAAKTTGTPKKNAIKTEKEPEKPANTQSDEISNKQSCLEIPDLVKKIVTEKMIEIQENIDRDSMMLKELDTFMKSYG